MNPGDDGFVRVSREILRRSRDLSLIILGVTLSCCIMFLGSVRYLDMPPMLHGSMGTSALILAWINRRAVMDVNRFRSVLRDPRLRHLRRIVVAMIAADAIALAVSIATGVRLLSDVFNSGG